MKFFKTILLLLISSYLMAQKATDNEKLMSKTLWDISYGAGCLKQNDYMFSASAQASVLFYKKIYLCASYSEALELLPNFVISLGPLGSEGSRSQSIKNTSVVVGTAFVSNDFYGTIGMGPSYSKGFTFGTSQKNGTEFNLLGVVTKASFVIVAVKNVGMGLHYAYDFNKVKNFQSLYFSLHIGVLR
jgi:hypothetical protein